MGRDVKGLQEEGQSRMGDVHENCNYHNLILK